MNIRYFLDMGYKRISFPWPNERISFSPIENGLSVSRYISMLCENTYSKGAEDYDLTSTYFKMSEKTFQLDIISHQKIYFSNIRNQS